MSAVSWDMAVGTEIAGYRITGILGRGGMSVVYTAEHIRLGRQVALKVLSPALMPDEAFRARFARESQLAATLDHPSIVAVYDAGEADGVLYIAMRLVPGIDLGALLERDGPLSLAQALFMLEQVGSALDLAHEQGLVHRDVKPANILIQRPSDRAYLTDFGVVKQTSSGGMTKTGYFLGTFEYAAPEQIEGLEIDGRTDIYALGCVLYETLSGEAPYSAATDSSVIHAHLVEPPPKLTSKRPDLPLGINDVIATAMAKAKDDRYPTCAHFVRALRGVALGGTSSAERSAPTVQSAQATVLPEPETSTSAAATDDTTGAAVGIPETAGGVSTVSPGADSDQPRPVRTIELTRRRLAVGAIVLVALVGAVIAAAVLLTRGSSTGAATESSVSTATTAGASTAAIARGLAGVVPASLMKYCKSGAPINGASETASCTAPAGATKFWPDSWSFSLYPSTPALLAAYNALRSQNGISKDFGRCDRTTWAGEGAWLHNPEPGAQPKPGGRRFCYFQGNVAVIVWMHEKLAQPNHIDALGIARASGSDHFNLFGWYAFWHHTVGKCIQPGCVARLK
jgi:Protein kinase domain